MISSLVLLTYVKSLLQQRRLLFCEFFNANNLKVLKPTNYFTNYLYQLSR